MNCLQSKLKANGPNANGSQKSWGLKLLFKPHLWNSLEKPVEMKEKISEKSV